MNYTLRDPDGVVLAEGYTTATAGNGRWGAFAFDIAFDVKRSGLGHLVVYEISASDGAHIHEASISIRRRF